MVSKPDDSRRAQTMMCCNKVVISDPNNATGELGELRTNEVVISEPDGEREIQTGDALMRCDE